MTQHAPHQGNACCPSKAGFPPLPTALGNAVPASKPNFQPPSLPLSRLGTAAQQPLPDSSQGGASALPPHRPVPMACTWPPPLHVTITSDKLRAGQGGSGQALTLKAQRCPLPQICICILKVRGDWSQGALASCHQARGPGWPRHAEREQDREQAFQGTLTWRQGPQEG